MSAGIRFEGLHRLRGHFEGAFANLSRMEQTLFRAGLLVAGEAQKNVTGGGQARDKLNVRTGRLRSSLHARLVGQRHVEVGTNVSYARIHEEGGMIFATRPPKRKSGEYKTGRPWLQFQTRDGKWVTVDRVRIPPRPFLGPALQKKRRAVMLMLRAVYAGPLRIGGEIDIAGDVNFSGVLKR